MNTQTTTCTQEDYQRWFSGRLLKNHDERKAWVETKTGIEGVTKIGLWIDDPKNPESFGAIVVRSDRSEHYGDFNPFDYGLNYICNLSTEDFDLLMEKEAGAARKAFFTELTGWEGFTLGSIMTLSLDPTITVRFTFRVQAKDRDLGFRFRSVDNLYSDRVCTNPSRR